MTVTERRYRVSAVEIDYFSIATIQIHALSRRWLYRQLAINLEQVIGFMLPCALHGYTHAIAGASSPVVSAKPSLRFIHCTAPPAAPLTRLSITTKSASESESVATPRWQ